MRRPTFYFLTLGSVFFLDRITKFLALKYFSLKEVSLCDGVSLELSWNRGISFGIFNQASPLGYYVLTAFIALIICGFSFHSFIKYRAGRPIFFEMIVLGGACSNFFDKIYYGAVIDFISLHAYVWHWPSFNFADAAIVVGIIGILWNTYQVRSTQ